MSKSILDENCQSRATTGNSLISNFRFNWMHKKKILDKLNDTFYAGVEKFRSRPRAFPYSLAKLSTREIYFAHVREYHGARNDACHAENEKRDEKSSTFHGCSSVQAELCDPRNNLAWQRDVSLL